jgi:hypothetical protein
MSIIFRFLVVLVLAVGLVACSSRPFVSDHVIEGTVFYDEDKDSQRDSAEASLAGRTVYLFGEREDSTVTDALGRYRFTNLPQGYYFVVQGFRPGWFRSYPRAGYHAERPDLPYDVAIFRVLAEVAADMYGHYTLKGGFGGYRLPQRYTDLGGSWEVHVSAPGQIVVQQGGKLFIGTLCEDGSLTGDIHGDNEPDGHFAGLSPFFPVASKLDFGTFPKCATGKVLLTLRDAEVGLAGWKVRLVGPTPKETVTDASGSFSFQDFEWGDYVATVDPPTGFAQLAPSALPLPGETQIARRKAMQSSIGRIVDSADFYYGHRLGKGWTGYEGFTIPAALESDHVARYAALPLNKEWILVSARSRDGLDTIALKNDRGGFYGSWSMTPGLEDRARSGPGEVIEILDKRYAGDHIWLDFRVAPTVRIIGQVRGRATSIRIAGASVATVAIAEDGAFRSEPLLPGPYVVIADDNRTTGATASRRSELAGRLAACMHRVSQIAADAYRFRVAQMSWGGGGGVYRGYRPPEPLRDADGLRTSLDVAATDVRITVSALDGSGAVSACFDWRGILSGVTVSGAFQELNPVVVTTDDVVTDQVKIVVPGTGEGGL